MYSTTTTVFIRNNCERVDNITISTISQLYTFIKINQWEREI